MALDGADHATILAHYYPGTTLEPAAAADARIRVLVGSGARVRLDAPAGTRVDGGRAVSGALRAGREGGGRRALRPRGRDAGARRHGRARAGRRADRGRRHPLQRPHRPAAGVRRRDRRRGHRHRRLRARRRRAGDAVDLGAGRARGPGGRGAHVRPRDAQARRPLRRLQRRPQPGLRRRRRADGLDGPGRRRDGRADPHLRGRAHRHLLPLHVRRAHGERRGRVLQRHAGAVPRGGRGPGRQALAVLPLEAAEVHAARPRPRGRPRRRGAHDQADADAVGPRQEGDLQRPPRPHASPTRAPSCA